MKNLIKIKEALIKEYGSKCSICGREFSYDNPPVIDCIIPCSKGGTEDLYNLQLTCRTCNIRKSNRFIPHEVFESYIQKIIEKSQKYQVVKEQNEYDRGIDLIIKDKDNYKLCEVKMETTFISNRIDNIVKSLKAREERYKKRYKKVTSVLIFPGEISIENMKILKDNKIEIWDRKYLKETFNKEILEINNPYFNEILYSIDKEKDTEYVRKINQKITELKECEPGNENWSNYQKLIGEILEILFCPTLERTIAEKCDYLGANRRDFIMPNYAPNGFWAFVREKYIADLIVIDAKNSSKGINKGDILQIANYLKRSGLGLFGLIIGRKYNQKTIAPTLREKWIAENKMIVLLEDKDIEQMLIQKRDNLEPETVIRQKIEEFRISI